MHNYANQSLLIKFSEKIIFDLQITIARVHPVQISSRSDYCITTDIMWKTLKMQKILSLTNRGLVPTKQPETDFPLTYRFRKTVDNVQLITYMKFQNILMTGWKDMGKKFWKYPPPPPMRIIPYLWTTRFFFENGALSLFYT